MLDDSTDEETRRLVDAEAAEWAQRGANIDVIRRDNRDGYKAGALREVIMKLMKAADRSK